MALNGSHPAAERAAPRQWHVAALRALGRPLPDALYLRIAHRLYYHRWPDYEHPRTLQEHIHAYTLRSAGTRDPALPMLACKLAVREHIEAALGPGHTVPVIGAWRRAADVPLELFRYPVVLKPTHLSGRVLLLDRWVAADEPRLRAQLRRWLERDHSHVNREWFYAKLRPGIVAEPMLLDATGQVPADVKMHVIGGRVRYLQVDRGRFGRATRNLYSPTWELLPARTSLPRHPVEPAPEGLAGMVEMAGRVAAPFEFLRVDFYLLPGRPLISELTSTPGSGFGRFFPQSFTEELAKAWPIGNPPRRSPPPSPA